ncbi:MAG: hypothetical protein LBC18_08380 [Opitutaceae bacterium]|jgi:hypothetical protein|nr:hypothetical protein [Opitutaceae bacterium]
MKHIFCLLFPVSCLLMPGCAGDYGKYLSAQVELARAHKQEPLVRIVAQEGRDITGLQSIEVFAPGPAGASVAAIAPPRNETLEFLGSGLRILGPILAAKFAGDAAVDLVRATGEAATVGYRYVQAPAANLTVGGNGVVGSGSYADLGGTGVIGGGTFAPIDSTHAPTVVEQPAPVVVEQPAPVIVTQPAPVIVTPPAEAAP